MTSENASVPHPSGCDGDAEPGRLSRPSRVKAFRTSNGTSINLLAPSRQSTRQLGKKCAAREFYRTRRVQWERSDVSFVHISAHSAEWRKSMIRLRFSRGEFATEARAGAD